MMMRMVFSPVFTDLSTAIQAAGGVELRAGCRAEMPAGGEPGSVRCPSVPRRRADRPPPAAVRAGGRVLMRSRLRRNQKIAFGEHPRLLFVILHMSLFHRRIGHNATDPVPKKRSAALTA